MSCTSETCSPVFHVSCRGRSALRVWTWYILRGITWFSFLCVDERTVLSSTLFHLLNMNLLIRVKQIKSNHSNLVLRWRHNYSLSSSEFPFASWYFVSPPGPGQLWPHTLSSTGTAIEEAQMLFETENLKKTVETDIILKNFISFLFS